jgi:hypothetical protein
VIVLSWKCDFCHGFVKQINYRLEDTYYFKIENKKKGSGEFTKPLRILIVGKN